MLRILDHDTRRVGATGLFEYVCGRGGGATMWFAMVASARSRAVAPPS